VEDGRRRTRSECLLGFLSRSCVDDQAIVGFDWGHPDERDGWVLGGVEARCSTDTHRKVFPVEGHEDGRDVRRTGRRCRNNESTSAESRDLSLQLCEIDGDAHSVMVRSATRDVTDDTVTGVRSRRTLDA
jgi:hypothetical protein